EALDQVFGTGTGAVATAPGGDATTPPPTGGQPPAPPPPGAPPAPPPATSDQLTAAVLELNNALANLREAQHTGDFTTYGAALDRLQHAIDTYLAAGGTPH
ncbi:membrane protein, partial [Rhodococcus opacus]